MSVDIEIMFHTPVYGQVVLDHKKLTGPKEYGPATAADSLYKRLTPEQRKIYTLHCEGDRYFLRKR